MSLMLYRRGGFATRFPRVSGDEPEQVSEVGPGQGFSPRERG